MVGRAVNQGPYENEIAEGLRARGYLVIQGARVGRLEVDAMTANACIEITTSRQPSQRTARQARISKIGRRTRRGVIYVCGARVFEHSPALVLDRIEASLRRPPAVGCLRVLRLW